MSQKTRATGTSSGCQGRSLEGLASGRASTSLSWTRVKPSMAEPSKVMPSSRAFSSSAGVMLKVLAVPRTSVNQSWTKRMPRSSTVLRTYSCWLRISPPLVRPVLAGALRRAADRALPVSQASEGVGGRVHTPFTDGQRARNPAVAGWRRRSGPWAGPRAARTCERASQPPPWCRRAPDPVDGDGSAGLRQVPGTRIGRDQTIERTKARPRRNRAEADPGGSASPGEGRGHRDRRRPVRRPARPDAALLGARPRAHRGRLRRGLRVRRIVDPGIPGDPGVGHAAHARPQHRGDRPLPDSTGR